MNTEKLYSVAVYLRLSRDEMTLKIKINKKGIIEQKAIAFCFQRELAYSFY